MKKQVTYCDRCGKPEDKGKKDIRSYNVILMPDFPYDAVDHKTTARTTKAHLCCRCRRELGLLLDEFLKMRSLNR